MNEKYYCAMNGFAEEQMESELKVPVKDEFVEGAFCDLCYQAVQAARERMETYCGENTRIGEDVEIILANMQEIAHYQALKMFDYGVAYGAMQQ
ncbi:hypothetical protein SAMN02910358_00746 [Lachnospiraceae bacterium XBB1006]|nr:hypothetical protein SAMN02910358_00746 [Lachnospiraceae bacterium XBB1006]